MSQILLLGIEIFEVVFPSVKYEQWNEPLIKKSLFLKQGLETCFLFYFINSNTTRNMQNTTVTN